MSPARARRRRGPVFALGIALGLTLAATIAAPVSAANNVVVLAYFGDCQFAGSHAGASKTVKIDWRDSDGNLKSKHSVTSNGAGAFVTKCEFDEQIETGDVLKTTIGTSARTYLVPPLTAKVGRYEWGGAGYLEGVVEGKTLPYQLVSIAVHLYGGGFVELAPTHSDWGASSNDAGNYWLNTSPLDDLKGFDYVEVSLTNNRGDKIVRVADVPAMQLWIGRAFVSVVGNPGTNLSMQLRRGSDELSTTGGNLAEGPNGFLFYDADGERVRAKVGDQVIGDFEDDADVFLPNITAVVSKTADKVTATCGIGAGIGILVRVHTRDYSKAQARTGFTGSTGFLANFATAPAYNIVSGDKVDVYCKLATGDIVAKTFTVL
jgi:hypothetical protein